MYSKKNPKIDIYTNGRYYCSTNWSKTCKEALIHFIGSHNAERIQRTRDGAKYVSDAGTVWQASRAK